MKDVVDEVEAISEKVSCILFPEELDFGYRQRCFTPMGTSFCSPDSVKGEPGALKPDGRICPAPREKQPLEYPSAGSVFRRPAGHYVGPMVEEMGLKATVSVGRRFP